jgi:uncharacterized protein involved in type VI secretion and phage assembly
MKLLGQDVNIEMKHKDGTGLNLFKGIITRVSYIGRHGAQNHIRISGCSPTILLDGSKTMDSFMDMNLAAIVSEAVSNSGNGGKVIAQPKFGLNIEYLCQYGESCFEFLNRLSRFYGEWFFYDGQDCYFGKKTGKTETLTYESEITEMDLSVDLLPAKMKRYQYFEHPDDPNDLEAPDANVIKYLIVAQDRSSSVYTSKATLPSEAAVQSIGELDMVIRAEKNSATHAMNTVSGAAQSSKVKIGGEIRVKLPVSMEVPPTVDTFLVTSVTHEYDLASKYRNTFTGIPATVENIPVAPHSAPVTGPQLAWVKENVDPEKHGRIKVQFQWQKDVGKTTNWIRVQTVDAGTSGAFPKNRGHVFIPELDDQVMIGFMYGDPNRPYMMGGMFPERFGKGGEVDNNIKSIKTRSGHMIEFNDEVTGGWGITIKDDCGNKIHLSTKGKNIDITAPETITISAKNIQVNANENIKMSAGEDIIESAGKNKTDTAGETHVTSAKNKNTFVEEDSYTQVKKNVKVDILKDATVNVDDDVSVKAGKAVIDVVKEDTFIKSRGKITLKNSDIVDVAQG